MVLTNNLDIQISKYTPILDQFALNALSAAYDPVASLSGRKNYDSSGGGIDPTTGGFYGSYSTISHTYAPGISGESERKHER